MTNILLSIIAVLLFARIVLQVRQGKRAVEKGFAAPSEVEHRVEISLPLPDAIESTIRELAKERWELVAVQQIDWERSKREVYLFFTRKKIKTYYD
jgi:hypothetical protein